MLFRVHCRRIALYHAVIDTILDVRALIFLPGEKPLVIRLVLREEERYLTFAGKDEFTHQRMLCRDRARARHSLDLLQVWFLGGSVGFGDPRRPVITEPERRQQVQFRPFRSPVGGSNTHQDVFRIGFGILHKDVEIAVFVKDAGIEQLILHFLPASSPVRLHKFRIGISCLGIFVKILHVGVGRRRVKVKVILLDVLAVVALAVRQSKEALLENRVPAVPQGKGKAQALLFVGKSGDAVLAPAVGARAGMVMGKEIPGVSFFAVVFAHRAPLAFAQVRPPFLPRLFPFTRFHQSYRFSVHFPSPDFSSLMFSFYRSPS
ncbi:MAG: hypothetical protein A4E72_01355 [Syntrophus sp. PtaU1.Bin208]|nr:MAG: hypothetical protein A4E72_01355 [Syntrophus sp. PtaU1.Bin208]